MMYRLYLKDWILKKFNMSFNRKYVDIIGLKIETEKAIFVLYHPIFQSFHYGLDYNNWIPKSAVKKMYFIDGNNKIEFFDFCDIEIIK